MFATQTSNSIAHGAFIILLKDLSQPQPQHQPELQLFRDVAGAEDGGDNVKGFSTTVG